MSLEVMCSTCHKRLVVQKTGVIVACPHCGDHLLVTSTQSPRLDSSLHVLADSTPHLAHVVPPSQPAPPPNPPVTRETPKPIIPPTQHVSSHANPPVPPRGDQSVLESRAASRPAVVPKLWFVLAISYASAVTLGLVLLWFSMTREKTHPIDNLPDITYGPDGRSVMHLVPEHAPLPDNHRLKLGESRQFGAIRFEPLRVTYGPAELAHYSDPNRTQPVDGELLKLWIRFTNESPTQAMKPLGSELVFHRVLDVKHASTFRANTFVISTSTSHDVAAPLLVFDLPLDGEWEFPAQDVDHQLQPGESFETFIPSSPVPHDAIPETMIWRVQFRKGIQPRTQQGVTTLVDVEFRRDEVSRES